MSEPQVSFLLADGVVLLHLAYVAFVASGYLAVPLGRALGWRWIRNRAYRRLHVAAMALVALEAVVGLICPLTLLENALRGRAETATFVGRLVRAVLYYDWPPWVFIAAYVLLTMLALLMYRLVPPRRRVDVGSATARAGGRTA
ncbi:MAG: DUF2784 domain-containing protein [SAR324 cluster bacterium]|nr:DUF2784 domain-containing protein [SAR324 cluster bacterium]